jgi:hypothetical protein
MALVFLSDVAPNANMAHKFVGDVAPTNLTLSLSAPMNLVR